MPGFDPIVSGNSQFIFTPPPAIERRVIMNRLSRILAFTRLTIHDVVNNPIAKNQVHGYYRLSKMIDRRSEIVELEKQWNPRA